MIIPIRCFTCGKVIANKWETYKELLHNGNSPKKSLDICKLKRYCCRRMFLSQVDVIDDILSHSLTVHNTQSPEYSTLNTQKKMY